MTTPDPHNRGPKHRMTAERFALMLNELLAGPSTVADLVEASGLAPGTVGEYLDQMNSVRDRRTRLVRVCQWDPDPAGRRTRAVWEWNPGGPPNVKRPCTPTAERTRQYRERVKQRAAGALSGSNEHAASLHAD